ncbi:MULTISPECIES: hypothetical protein [Legionella]|uniref:Uncharacterized protein n=1 Tax=Legionella drozanskii LLAP-1 TaxID=1212489 RepID=A0A0W0SKV8_9GAMM|nr:MULTISPECIES: hypothetical protein [Legionella]KTC83990.1 hypothetical protein Ldro_3110 [Legionella drozanskii LLAP-1]PJE15842.1 MAG: hypothetical protein CK430_03800 [Legionella sp.]
MFNKFFLFAIVLILPSLSFGFYDRKITNQSNYTWIIVDSSRVFAKRGFIQFDRAPDKYPKACLPVNAQAGEACFLEPGQTTYVRYVFIYSSDHRDWEDTRKVITFINPLTYETVLVQLEGDVFEKSLKMESSNPKKLNDSHGDITIFNP